MTYFVTFLEFSHQTARERAEIECLHCFRLMVMVVVCKYHYPTNKPPPLFCPSLHSSNPFLVADGVLDGFLS